jgi:intracellular sulfur oxidation DsrE/DsrF family protein
MGIKFASLCVTTGLFLALAVQPLHAGENGKTAPHAKKAEAAWVYPVIAKFGGVHPRPDVDMQPDPNADYKIFVDVVSIGKDPSRPIQSLDRLARLVNLMGYAKVPADHVHIVALLDEKAGMAALTDAAYARIMTKFDRKHAKKGMKNPNLPILHALKQAGVKLMVCSQAMAGLGLKDSDIDPSVTITLSGLTDPVIYGHRGYTFMQL